MRGGAHLVERAEDGRSISFFLVHCRPPFPWFSWFPGFGLRTYSCETLLRRHLRSGASGQCLPKQGLGTRPCLAFWQVVGSKSSRTHCGHDLPFGNFTTMAKHVQLKSV